MGKNLGRGISSFLPDVDEESSLNEVSIDSIVPNQYQPRKYFDAEAIKSLSESIKEKGVIQPLVVREIGDGKYELIAGERRLRASKLAGLTEVPVVVKQLTDDESLEIAILENIQREDLNPLEEAEGYKRLMDEFSKTQENIAQMVGKSRSHIANMLRLLTLDPYVQEKLLKNEITVGHAKVLVGFDDAKTAVDRIVAENLNVRQTEKLIADMKAPQQESISKTESDQVLEDVASEIGDSMPAAQAPKPKKLPRVSMISEIEASENSINEHDALSQQLSKILRTNVKIHLKGDQGAMLIYFANLGELDRLLKQIMNSNI